MSTHLSRRSFLRSTAVVAGGALCAGVAELTLSQELATASSASAALKQFGYAEVKFRSGIEDAQLKQTHGVLMGLSDDELLKPFRIRSGQPAPGKNMGGWYDAFAFAPGHSFGQWVSALSRYYAITGEPATHAKLLGLVRGYGAIPDQSGRFFENNRFPAYTLDKLNCGLIDAAEFGRVPEALAVMRTTTDAALPHLPEKALSRAEQQKRPHPDISYTYDESYTLPENYFLAWMRGGDRRYRELAIRFLHDKEFFDPLSENQNVLPGLHAYSHLNALNSAMQAYFALNDPKYLRAAVNGFRMIQEQSYATGGWGPDERFVVPGQGALGKSLLTTHNSFETPCGAYGHFKLTRSLLRATKDSRYGDSMETVMYNTVLGSRPLQGDGSAFYYSDYNSAGRKVFARDKWPCCSGTLPQIAADYRISAYLHDDTGVYVNLYIPSTLTWKRDTGAVTITQSGTYPTEGVVRLHVENTSRSSFTVYLRIPGWAGNDARITLNGKPYEGAVAGGTFFAINAVWGKSNRIELTLPMRMRLQAVDEQTPGTVALMRGPLVLFRIGSVTTTLRESELLKAREEAAGVWIVQSATGDATFRPFTSITQEPYSTYFSVA